MSASDRFFSENLYNVPLWDSYCRQRAGWMCNIQQTFGSPSALASDKLFILENVDRRRRENMVCMGERATQVILFGDVVALQPCNQVKLSGKTCS